MAHFLAGGNTSKSIIDSRKLYVTYPVFSIGVDRLHAAILTQFIIHVKPFMFVWGIFFHLPPLKGSV